MAKNLAPYRNPASAYETNVFSPDRLIIQFKQRYDVDNHDGLRHYEMLHWKDPYAVLKVYIEINDGDTVAVLLIYKLWHKWIYIIKHPFCLCPR